jgi:deoxyribodipyrimidine photo-lyase
MLKKRRAIVWFRQDLRLHDNVALLEAIDSAIEVIPVYVFDERFFGADTDLGFPKTGPHRNKFVLESVADLRKNLRRINGQLIVRVGKTEDILFDIAERAKSGWIFCNRERTPLEVQIQDNLEQRLWSIGQEMRYSRGKMLYHTADLPFPIQHVPDSFAQFRKETERYVAVREPLPEPASSLAQLTCDIDPGEMPSMADFGFEDYQEDPRGNLKYEGGETAGLERLRYYFRETEAVESYRESRNELQGDLFSTKFSPWLAYGCLSPKTIFQEFKAYEDAHGSSKSTHELFYYLLLRDHHRFMAKKYGDLFFEESGIQGSYQNDWSDDYHTFHKWANGETGVPLVDAAMVELYQTGYLSNRARQNVASFLINDLQVNWQFGASYFESMLIDYDVTSNWGNWNQMAGVGSEVRDDQYLNIEAQALRYDPQGEYVKKWLPQFKNMPGEKIHHIHRLSPEEVISYGLDPNGPYIPRKRERGDHRVPSS